MYLEEDKLYYMEVLHKEDVLYDFMCVGAQFPTKKKQQPISSKHLVVGKTGMVLQGIRITAYLIATKLTTRAQDILLSDRYPFLLCNQKKRNLEHSEKM